MSTSESPYRFESTEGYSVVSLQPELNDAQWSDFERIGSEILEKLDSMQTPAFLIDLSSLSYMGSAMVALIVRVWKSIRERNGRMVVVNQHDMVFEVMKLAGLHTVWTIVGTRDEAVQALGVRAKTGGGEQGIALTALGLVAILGAAVGLYLLMSPTEIVQSKIALVIVFVAGIAGVIAGMVSVMKESGWQQKFGMFVIAASVLIGVTGILNLPDGLGAPPKQRKAIIPVTQAPNGKPQTQQNTKDKDAEKENGKEAKDTEGKSAESGKTDGAPVRGPHRNP